MPTVRFQLRRDTAANWTSVNPTLSSGEPAVETDTRRQKLGDGVTPWNSLAYVADGTVKSVAGASSASGFELTGGPITSSGTLTFGVSDAALARVTLGLGSTAVQNIGTTGATVPLLSGANTWTGAQDVSARLAVTRSAASPPVTPVGDFIVFRDTFGAVSIYSGRSSTSSHAVFSGYSSYGTVGVPTSIGNSNALILTFSANAWDVNTTNYANVGSIDLLSTSPHTTTNLGTYWRFTCTAPGSLAPIDVARITDAGLQMYGANTVIDANRLLHNRTYTVAAAPSPTGIAGTQFYCTNPAAGQARPYWSNGTEWRDATGTLLA
jgi:hypothetical protein